MLGALCAVDTCLQRHIYTLFGYGRLNSVAYANLKLWFCTMLWSS